MDVRIMFKNNCLVYLGIIIAAVVGILMVFKLENETNLITGGFATQPPQSKWFVLPVILVFLLILFLALSISKRRKIEIE